MQFQQTELTRQVAQIAHDFAEQAIRPHVMEWDESQEFPIEVFKKLGELMLQTHIGLSKEYEVSCDELDFLVDAVQNEKSVLGARMMGGGFGGCSINLVEKGLENELIKKIAAKYKTAFGIDLKSYKVKISKGTSFVKN